jgi:hypothetical protein
MSGSATLKSDTGAAMNIEKGVRRRWVISKSL